MAVPGQTSGCSTLQSIAQPSPSAVLPSSHSSPGPSTASPQPAVCPLLLDDELDDELAPLAEELDDELGPLDDELDKPLDDELKSGPLLLDACPLPPAPPVPPESTVERAMHDASDKPKLHRKRIAAPRRAQ